MNPIDQIKDLNNFTSNGTSLISFYIKGGSDISIASNLLIKEMSASNNIKSKSVRKDVQSALRSMQHHLKTFSAIPDNGLAIFSGNEYLI